MPRRTLLTGDEAAESPKYKAMSKILQMLKDDNFTIGQSLEILTNGIVQLCLMSDLSLTAVINELAVIRHNMEDAGDVIH